MYSDITSCDCNIPAHTRDSIEAWVQQAVPPGDFLRAVLTNDLKGAFVWDDEQNQVALYDIVKHLYNCVPGICWGSAEKVAAWDGLNR